MSEAIIVAIITGAVTLVGVMLQNHATTSRLMSELDKKQSVTDTKMEDLTREVRKHNSFAERLPVVEEQIKVINHRIADLEEKV